MLICVKNRFCKLAGYSYNLWLSSLYRLGTWTATYIHAHSKLQELICYNRTDSCTIRTGACKLLVAGYYSAPSWYSMLALGGSSEGTFELVWYHGKYTICTYTRLVLWVNMHKASKPCYNDTMYSWTSLIELPVRDPYQVNTSFPILPRREDGVFLVYSDGKQARFIGVHITDTVWEHPRIPPYNFICMYLRGCGVHV